LLAEEPDAERMRAHPKLLTHILREASWATDELNIRLWAGLLASSCSAHAPDDANEIFANLLVHLTPTEARIFVRACERASAAISAVEAPATAPEALVSAPAPEALASVPETSASAVEAAATLSEASVPQVPAAEPEISTTVSETAVAAPQTAPDSSSLAPASEAFASAPDSSAPPSEAANSLPEALATTPQVLAAERESSTDAADTGAPPPQASSPAPGRSAPASASIIFTPKEMIEATGVYDLYRNATDLAYLFNLGLVRKVFDFTSYRDADSFDVTPSNLGLELYKRCHGHRGVVDAQHVESAKAHLANFIPAPQLLPPDKENLTPLPTYKPE